MKTINITRTRIRIISYFIALTVVLSASTVSLYFSSQDYKRQVETSRQRALSELCESIDAIAIVLQKEQYSSSYQTMSRLASSLNTQSACAKAALSEIESSDIYTADIYRFLSQIGDYTDSVTTQLSSGESATLDGDTLAFLLRYARELSDSLNAISTQYYDGSLSFEESKSNLSLYKDTASEIFSKSFSAAEQALGDYPTLVYDGPFSDHMGNREPKAVKGLSEISRSEAKAAAAKLTGLSEGSLRAEDDEVGKLYVYRFSTDKLTVGITKNGGKLCYIISGEYEGESTISVENAIDRGAKLLNTLGYKSMTDTYYSTYDGICTINYAFEENGVVCYPDLIKVGVSLETGKIISLDARTYLMNHTERKLTQQDDIKLEKARSAVLKSLEIVGEKTAVIPTKSDREYLCFEFHCKDDNEQEVLIYIDCETADEREILLLLYSDGGVLTE